MKTLNKSVTAKFFRNENGYEELVSLWSTLTNNKANLTSSHQLLYLILKGKDWTRGFTPVKSSKKLENGAHKYTGIMWAFSGLFGLNNKPRRIWDSKTYRDETAEEVAIRNKASLEKNFPEIAGLLSDNFIEELNRVVKISQFHQSVDYDLAYVDGQVYLETE